MNKISTKNAPVAGGHYSQATVHNGLVFISGQLSIDPTTGSVIKDSIESETRQVLQNVIAIAEAAGSARDEILKMTIYISDGELWGQVNQVYEEIFGDHKPARAIVPVKTLHYGCKIEAEAIAAVKK